MRVYLFIGKLTQLRYIGCRLIKFSCLRVEVSLHFALFSVLGELLRNKRLLTTSIQPHSKDSEKTQFSFCGGFFCLFTLFQQLDIMKLQLCY